MTLLGYHEHSDTARDEFEPRGTDICPECGNAHTIEFGRSGFFTCTDCGSIWHACTVLCARLHHPKDSDTIYT